MVDRIDRRRLLAIPLAVLCACGGGSKHAQNPTNSTAPSGSSGSASATSTTAPGTSTPATVDPNAPEINQAGDIPDNQVFVPFTFSGGPYRVSVPEGWARTDGAASTSFTDNFNSVRLDATAAASAPTVRSATDNEVPAIQAASTNFQLANVTSIGRHGGPAVLITYTADSAPNPVTGAVRPLAFEHYEFWNNGREAILVFAGPVGADNVDPWRTISDSFAWS
jgi:hypothetical protein